ncbi:MAG TPA: hypothetical protein VF272_03990, partial [Candidatus Saccharimonadia bacterium]
MKSKLMNPTNRSLSAIIITGLLLSTFIPGLAQAAQLTNRKVTLGTSQPSVSTTHNYTFTAPSATTVKSVDFTYCTTPSGTCTLPSG